MKNLVLVESPAKAKTIERYLGKDFTVRATYGHVRDLPRKELGIDTEKDFEPNYVSLEGKKKVITKLKKELKTSKDIYLAVDPDREGEAIGWHVALALGLIRNDGHTKNGAKHKVKRIFFHEITKSAVLEALNNPRKINMDLVDAQQARRVLDRLVGYKLSPLLWKKIRFGLSAGRVQSVAVKIVVDRERERDAFKKEEYWELFAIGEKGKGNKKIKINTIKADKDGKDYVQKLTEKEIKFQYIPDKKTKIGKTAIKTVAEKVSKEKWSVTDIEKKTTKKNPSPPFTTSTLQQTALNKLGFASKRTMRAAQKLYEQGLITYIRTDSFFVSKSAIKQARTYIKKEFGDKYLSSKERIYKTKAKSAQEAHEAIRPSHYKKNPKSLKLGVDEMKLYSLIWQRALATQMSEALVDNTKLISNVADYRFEARGQQIIFDGYLKIYKDMSSDIILPKVEIGDELNMKELQAMQKYTKPPARYTEASLIKALEKEGIGRPSTYSTIMSVIGARGYVGKEGRYFYPTDVGYVVNDFLTEYFDEIVDLKFTAQMENDLDQIAEGKLEWVPMIRKFYEPFEKKILKKDKTVKKEDVTVIGKSDKKCPECGGEMVIKLGKYGRFLSCKNFPDCKGMLSCEDEKEVMKEIGEKYESAPKTKEGKLFVLKTGKYGKFWAHPDYPKVKEALPLILKAKCPECGAGLVERKGKWGKTFIGCSAYPKCKYIERKKKEKKVNRVHNVEDLSKITDKNVRSLSS